jgi:hypothetical protein
MYVIQHCFICRPSDFTVSEDAGIEPRTAAILALTARRFIHSGRSHSLFLGELECVGHSFAYVAHLVFLRDVLTRTHRAAVASRRATNLAAHLPNLATRLPT